MLRAITLLMLLFGTSARASRFEDLGPSLGLPRGSPGATIGRTLVAGVSAVDIDGDGDDDLLTTEPLLGFSVYLREGATFVRAPQWSATLLDVYGHVAFDMDGDDDSDVLVAANGAYRLYENVGDKLVDVSVGRVPGLPGWSFTAAAVDLDGDRDLDLLLARYIDRPDFPAHRCHDNLVLDNDGHGRFRDVSAAIGLSGVRGCSFVLVAHDVDDDDDLDMIAINDFSQFVAPNVLWRNVGRGPAGLPRFEAESASVGLDLRGYGMGIAVGDLDENGRNDYFVTNVGAPPLLELDAGGRFVSSARGTNLRYGRDLNLVTWVTRMVDLDRDGYLDIVAAVGKLTAASFIDNPAQSQSLWLRGQPDGTLKVTTGQLEIADNSGRDLAFTDIDGDGRPELVMVHIHGGLSVMRDTAATPPATTLALTPSATGPGAAGAVLTLRCGEVTRTRTLIGGGDYGNADDGVITIAFPPPCDAPGQPLTGRVRWPSGYVQAVTATTGARNTIDEPSWLVVTPGRLEVDLSGHLGNFEALALEPLGAVVVGAREAVGPRHWRWSPSGAGAATIALDGHSLGVLVRWPASFETWFEPPQPVAGLPLTIYARGVSAVGWQGGETIPMVSFKGELGVATLTAPTAGEHMLQLMTAQGPRTQALVVTPLVDRRHSEVYLRELHVPASEIGTRTLRVRFRLRDANNRLADLPLSALQLTLDGVLLDPVERGYDGEVPTLLVPHSRLKHGSVLQPLVDGAPLFGPFVVGQIANAEALGAMAASDRSCQLSEPYLRADGNDRGSVLVQLYDASGTRLPDLGHGLVLESEGVNVLTREVVASFGGWLVPVQAGTVPGVATLRARLPGQAIPVTCSFPLWPALPLPAVAPGSSLELVAGPLEVAVRATFRWTPRDADGLAIGSGVDFDFVIGGDAAEARVVSGRACYRGLGRYEVDLTPTQTGALTVSVVTPDGAALATLAYALEDVAETDVGPELVEADAVEDLVEPTPEVVETDGVSGEQDILVDLAPDEVEVVALDTTPVDVGAEVHDAVVEATEVAEAEGAVEESQRDDGCASAHGDWGEGLVAASLLVARGARKRRESPSRAGRRGAPWRSR